MEKVDITIIGAGVVGLAIAERLSGPEREIVVLDRHDGFGREASSRNSEVIHAGLYYPEQFLKTRLCIRGNRMLYRLCESEGIPYRKTGKIVVATSPEETGKVEALLEQGRKNGAEDLRLLSKKEIKAMEPHVAALMGLYSPESGILDSHRLMKYLEQSTEAGGSTIAYNCELTGVSKGKDGFELVIRDADEEQIQLRSTVLINSAGLNAGHIAALAGIDLEEAGYRIHPCKGEYFSISGRHRGKISRLVYPLPTPVFPGAHVVLSLDGRTRIGPNAIFVEKIDYDVDPAHLPGCFQKARRFLPFLEEGDLGPDLSGIRPKLYGNGEPVRDFVIQEEGARGLPGLINLIGIESPGLTSCLAIAEKVESMVSELGI